MESQVDYDKEGNAYAKKLRDKKNVNKRRNSLGMETLEDYLVKVNDMHKQMNKRN
jgi:hypothetical protein